MIRLYRADWPVIDLRQALHHRTQPPVPRVTQPALDEDDE